ncbi:hypothetical protein Q8X48_22170 [Pseudomonas sp. QLc11A]|uniref:Uncharacterized protein n=1 Tax=Pseudomonas azerbaijanorientalis TaxID=2842350 RepID=A0ABW8W338_9PSED|nr:hypothetical protein C1X65_22665 [Pseudomonas sp. FW305-70]
MLIESPPFCEEPGARSDSETRLHFGAVWSANPAEEDSIYGKYTPCGEYVVSVAADRAEHFEEGKDYYFDISPAF